jgi:hypothetical protein
MYSGKESGEIIIFLTAGSFLFFFFRLFYIFSQDPRKILKKGVFIKELEVA